MKILIVAIALAVGGCVVEPSGSNYTRRMLAEKGHSPAYADGYIHGFADCVAIVSDTPSHLMFQKSRFEAEPDYRDGYSFGARLLTAERSVYSKVERIRWTFPKATTEMLPPADVFRITQ